MPPLPALGLEGRFSGLPAEGGLPFLTFLLARRAPAELPTPQENTPVSIQRS